MVKRKAKPQYRGPPAATKPRLTVNNNGCQSPGTSGAFFQQLVRTTATRKRPSIVSSLAQLSLERLKESADFSLTVSEINFNSDGSDALAGKLGIVPLSILRNNAVSSTKTIDNHSQVQLYFGYAGNFLFQDTKSVVLRLENVDLKFWRSFCPPSSFQLVLETVDPDQLVVEIWLRRAALEVRHDPDQNVKNNRTRRNVCYVVSQLLRLPSTEYDANSTVKPDLDEFYAAIRKLHVKQEVGEVAADHPDLVPQLRHYQAQAVSWMMDRERCPPSEVDQLHPLYVPAQLSNNGHQCTVYFNRFGGTFCETRPLVRQQLPGGILADEMGLGKSVEMLALILSNPRTVKQLELAESDWWAEFESDKSLSCSEPDSLAAFQCVCGEGWKDVDEADDDVEVDDDQTAVRCGKCRLWQHARCVEYSRHGPADRYFCPHCWVTLAPYPSRATVVVTPSTIEKQWVDELARHLRANALRVLLYSGVQQMGFVAPTTLADHDVVLVNYNTLRRELNYVDVPQHSCSQDESGSGGGYRFRQKKRYVALPSPMTAVQWWRVCLDEAQMVEGGLTRQARMVLRLPAVNRWCVTGTPIQRSIADLYYLLVFLGTEPYCTQQWWNACLLQPYLHGHKEDMHRVLGQLMWRTAKRDVAAQLGIPAQTETVHWLSFSPIEEHFYREQHVTCTRLFELGLRRVDLDADLSRLDRHLLAKIMAPLLRVRQACCHPQVVRGQFVAMRKSTMTMEELLQSLIKKTRLQCEDAHRVVVSSLNGLAALHIIEQSWPDAVDAYRQVLQSTAELRSTIKTDKLQQLHTLRNLAEILEAGHPNIAAATRDSELRADAKKVQDKYLSKYLSQVLESRAALRTVSVEIEEVRGTFKCLAPWWSSILRWLRRVGHAPEAIAKIQLDLSSKANDNMSNKFQDAFGLEYLLSCQLERLESAHDKVEEAVQRLEDEPCERTVNMAAACHLRPTSRTAPRCVYCLADDLFRQYESRLFSMQEHAPDENSGDIDAPPEAEQLLAASLRRGNWADGETERAMKSLLTCSRRLGAQREWCDDGATHLRLLDACKRQFRALRSAWINLRDQASALDELAMATHRLRLRAPDEPPADPPQPDILEPSELDQQRLRLNSDLIVARGDRQRRLGQLGYLRSLADSDYGRRGGGANPEPCPICQQALGRHWSVLQCGHCYCVACMRVLIVEYSGSFRSGSVKCAVCRQPTQHGEISYCNTGDDQSSEDTEDEIQVSGSHSTKVEAVVRQVLRIKRADSTAKTLVFSSWTAVLEILEQALRENGLQVHAIFGKYKFQTNLDSFRRDPGADVLLLSVASGAKGLNIVEATHVVLVEPTLNWGSELQAIGRVHRIGQTRATFVHRFLVRGTIEERIQALMGARHSGQEAEVATTIDTEERQLTPRHLLSLFASHSTIGEDLVDHN